MAETTGISWCDATWNPWVGCQKTGSPACEGCYAQHLIEHRFGRAVWGGPHEGAGTRARTSPSTWALPRKLERQAVRERRVLFCFCASLADIFDAAVPPQWRADAFAQMRTAPHVVFLLLTKRPHLIVKLAEEAGGLPPNAALLTTVVTQKEADEMIPHLLIAGAKLQPRFLGLSIEPMVEPVDVAWSMAGPIEVASGILRRGHFSPGLERIISVGWVITGGGTDQGPWKAPPTPPGWYRQIRDACTHAGAVYHHKQNGEWAPGKPPPSFYASLAGKHRYVEGQWFQRVGKKAAGRLLDGVIYDARPEVRP